MRLPKPCTHENTDGFSGSGEAYEVKKEKWRRDGGGTGGEPKGVEIDNDQNALYS